MATMRQQSREEWDGASTREDIKIGSLQRIADACELMAKNYQYLIDDRNRYQKWYRDERENVIRSNKQISSLRGQITKLRNAKKAAEVPA